MSDETTLTEDQISKGPLMGIVHTVDGKVKVLRAMNWGHGYYLDDAKPEDWKHFNDLRNQMLNGN